MKEKTVPDLWSIYLQTFCPKITWFHSGVSRFNLYCFVTILLLSLILKILFIDSGLTYLLLHIFQHVIFSNYLHSFLPFLVFLINPHDILSNHYIKIEGLFNFVKEFSSRKYPDKRTIIKV